MTMNTCFLLGFVCGLTLVGDYFIKIASDQTAGLTTPIFLLGALCYGLPAIGWFFLMRAHSLAMVAVLYSAGTLLLMALMGLVVFKESLGLREALGIALALASVVVMTSEA